MKKTVILLVAILMTNLGFTQTGFNYKALLTVNGNVLSSQPATIKFTVLKNGNISVYQETQSTTTDANGIFSLNIGEGTVVSGDFTTIDWGNNTYFLKVEINTGNGYQDFGTTELKYVPYAKYAEKAGNVFSGDFNDLNNIPTGLSDGDDDTHLTELQVIAYVASHGYLTQVDNIRGIPVSPTVPNNGQVLKYNGSQFVPADDDVSGGSGSDGVVNSAAFSGTTTKTLTLSRSNGLGNITATFTDAVNDADHSTTNELQTIIKNGSTIILSNGGGSILDSDTHLTEAQVDAYVANNGYLTQVDNIRGVPVSTSTPNNGQVLTFDGTNWTPSNISNSGGGGTTLDQAYDQGGAGDGKNIIADAGAVRVDGTDGFLVTGTSGSGINIDSEVTGAGTRMFFNPKKVAFRVGSVSGSQWDNNNIGINSFAMGIDTKASGETTTAIGFHSEALGDVSTAIGISAKATGNNSISIGNGTNAYSFGEIAMGGYNTSYAPASTSTWDTSDRLFVIGNGQINNKHNALVIYKDGRMNINDSYFMPLTDGTSGQIMQTNGAGQVSFVDASSLGLDDADFYKEGTSTPPTDINDNIYHSGNLAIGINTTETSSKVTVKQLGNDSGDKKGVYSDISNANSDSHYGFYSKLYGTGSGSHYGSFNDILGIGTGSQYGVKNKISNSGNGEHYGIYSYLYGDGSGEHFGSLNQLSGSGTSSQYGVKNYINNSGDSTHYGNYSSLSGSGSGDHYGNFNYLTGSGTGDQYGVNNYINNLGDSAHYGNYSTLSGSGSGDHYGSYNQLSGTGTGNKYGSYNVINATGTGTQVAVYGEVVDGTGNYAGQFNGNVEVMKKLVAPNSGDADMKAYAYGFVNPSGNPIANRSSLGFTVTKTGTGKYKITLTGVTSNHYIVNVTPEYDGTPIISNTDYITNPGNQFEVLIFNLSGNYVNRAFHFVVYKK